MLENTAHTTERIPNTLALVASQMVLEKAKEFREQARQAAEEARKAENARARQAASKNDGGSDEISISADASAGNVAVSQPVPSQVQKPPSDPRGGSVDLNI